MQSAHSDEWALVGESERIPFDTIALVERHNFNLWKTILLVGGGAMMALAAVTGAVLLAQ